MSATVTPSTLEASSPTVLKLQNVLYEKRNGIAYELFDSTPHKPPRISYSDNFAYNRRGAWTH